MSDLNETGKKEPPRRCPHCDSVVAADASQCLMCGRALSPGAPPAPPPAAETAPVVDEDARAAAPVDGPAAEAAPAVVASVMREREAPLTLWLTAVFAVIIIVLGALVLRFQGPVGALALVPTATPIPPTPTLTPTWTPLPTETRPPTAVPTDTPIPPPTATLQPPRDHTVTSGETLIGLALRYRVSVESIAAANNLPPNAELLVNQQLSIPYPTPTPPLAPVGIEVRGELVIADPTNCERYQVQSGDSLSSIAARYDVDFALFLKVNRLTEESIIQPGDTVCIPEIIYGATLQPTPGPSPTPTLTPLPAGPHLLYPVNGATLDPPDGVITLQWVAVKDLTAEEWYMVEVTDLDEVDSLPYRGFTRDTSFQIPSSWRPQVEETHEFRWRVSIVQVTGFREDGLPYYTYGGESSTPSTFYWLGAPPTPTPPPTPTDTPEP